MTARISVERERELVTDYLNGMSVTKISRRRICSTATVYRYLELSGISLRPDPHQTYKIDQTFFSPIDSEEKAYVLGFVTADGCVHNGSLVISLCKRDVAQLRKIRTCLKSEHPIKQVRLAKDPTGGRRL